MIMIGKKFKKETPKPEHQKFGLYQAIKNSQSNTIKTGDIVAGFQWLDGKILKQAIVFPDGHVSLFWTHADGEDFDYIGPVTEIN